MARRAASRFFLSLLLVLISLSCLTATFAVAARVSWTLDDSYQGPHTDSYQKLRAQIPILIRQTTIDLSVRLGLDFQEGWSFPLIIRFVDVAPHGVENVLAYVQRLTDDAGHPAQSLNINLEAYDRREFNFEKVVAHELVHAMLNDAMGVEASSALPVWLHEGLAVYGADQGEALVRATVLRYDAMKPEQFVRGLDGPHDALHYLEDYLAIKYMHDEHGVNSLHNFVREIVRRKGDVPGAVEYTNSEDWESFQKNARAFAIAEIERVRRNERTSTPESPY